jgi:NAD(P)-dependent dehydrogenase (short-subunit alcohol dehydrogenase family)
MDLGLKDRVALVTGAGSQIGFGKAICLTLAKEGADIVANDVDMKGAEKTAAEVRTLGRKALAIKADVSSSKQVNGMVKEALDYFGKIDILVNNAGINRCINYLAYIKDKERDREIAVNFNGYFNCCRAVVPHMVKRQYGKIINMASVTGKVSFPLQGVYSASKGAIMSLTRALACEVAKYGINVNAVCPGITPTAMMPEEVPQDLFNQYADAIPMGRLGTTQDVASLIAFLASDVSSYIHGQSINVDGGFVVS